MQSHLLKGESPTYGPVTSRLVEYGIARLSQEHKGQIVEPLAFLSLMKWLKDEGHLNLQANLRLRPDNEQAVSAFEEVGILYMLRALRCQVPFTTVFDFRCTPPWANEVVHMVSRLNKVDVAVDAPENPGFSVVHYASSIEDIIHWVDNPDNASVVLIPSHLFGPSVMARCRSSLSKSIAPPKGVLLIGRFKAFTVGNKDSLDGEMVAEAVKSLHPGDWFKQSVCH